MMRSRLALLALIGGLLSLDAGSALAQPPRPASPRAAEQAPIVPPSRLGVRPGQPAEAPAAPHRPGELDCKNCHEGPHRGVVRMYLGLGGRGTPMIPSHMFQVRVECTACHIAPKEVEGAASLVGRTFRPSEEACVNCHGEKYRGMLARWSSTLARMRETLAPKLAGARAALPSGEPNEPKPARARQLVDDAAFNIQFTALGQGVHNVFYAADLLKRQRLARRGVHPPRQAPGADRRDARPWRLLRRPLPRAGRRPAPGHRYLRQAEGPPQPARDRAGSDLHRLPLGRGPQGRHRHRPDLHLVPPRRAERPVRVLSRQQAAFYRGTVQTDLVKVEPNPMAEAVPCTGCHDFGSGKHSRQAVGQKCVGCHEAPYLALATEWTSGFDADAVRAAAAIQRAESALVKARQARRPTPASPVVIKRERLMKEARAALALVRQARGAHNPGAADRLLDAARRKAEDALARAGR
jgi:hypothetical protein